MTDNSPKAVVLRHVELYNDGTPESYGSDRFLELLAEDAVQEFLPSAQFPQGTRLQGKAAIRANLTQVSASWRDRRWVAHDVVADGDRVAARITMEGTHEGPLFGREATGRRFTVNEMNIYRLEDAKIAETWQLVDIAGFMSQIGA